MLARLAIRLFPAACPSGWVHRDFYPALAKRVIVVALFVRICAVSLFSVGNSIPYHFVCAAVLFACAAL